MNLIIDTHIFLWALAEPEKISDVKRSALEDLANTVYVSAISIAEIMIKASLDKLHIDFNPVVMSKESGFNNLDFSAEAALFLKDLPFHHKDPFDRMLIAQSLATGYTIMTENSKFLEYDCRLI